MTRQGKHKPEGRRADKPRVMVEMVDGRSGDEVDLAKVKALAGAGLGAWPEGLAWPR